MFSVFGEPEGALLVVPVGTHHEKGQRVLPLCWTHSSEVMERVPGRSLAAALLPGCEGALLELCRLLPRAGSVLRGGGVCSLHHESLESSGGRKWHQIWELLRTGENLPLWPWGSSSVRQW